MNANGRVLRLGADTNTVTLIHYAEYLADVPSKRRVRRHRRLAAPRGPEIRVVECLDDSNGIVDWPGEDYFSVILGTTSPPTKCRAEPLVGRRARSSRRATW